MISEKGFVLENGTELPFLGFGTWLVKEEKIILDALASGYRHIDTARRYENEKMVGNALRQCGIPRRELFLTSKVWKTEALKPPSRICRCSIWICSSFIGPCPSPAQIGSRW